MCVPAGRTTTLRASDSTADAEKLKVISIYCHSEHSIVREELNPTNQKQQAGEVVLSTRQGMPVSSRSASGGPAKHLHFPQPEKLLRSSFLYIQTQIRNQSVLSLMGSNGRPPGPAFLSQKPKARKLQNNSSSIPASQAPLCCLTHSPSLLKTATRSLDTFLGLPWQLITRFQARRDRRRGRVSHVAAVAGITIRPSITERAREPWRAVARRRSTGGRTG